MRISPDEKSTIISAVHAQDPEAIVYLFGSRVRDDLKGGDIDLLVISRTITFASKLDILVRIKTRIGDQKIDLKVVSPDGVITDPFVQSVLSGAVQLSG